MQRRRLPHSPCRSSGSKSRTHPFFGTWSTMLQQVARCWGLREQRIMCRRFKSSFGLLRKLICHPCSTQLKIIAAESQRRRFIRAASRGAGGQRRHPASHCAKAARLYQVCPITLLQTRVLLLAAYSRKILQRMRTPARAHNRDSLPAPAFITQTDQQGSCSFRSGLMSPQVYLAGESEPEPERQQDCGHGGRIP